MKSEKPARTSRRNIQIAVSVIALLLIATGGWFVAAGDVTFGDQQVSSATPGAQVPIGVPTIVSADQFKTLASSHNPIYWAGVRNGTRLEVTLTARNAVFVRYLPSGVDAGSTDEFLTVATYDALDGYNALASAERKLADIEQAKSGAIIVTFKKKPNSTYFTFPRAAFQVEVYSPSDGQSRQLTRDGDIQLVAARS